MLTRDDLTITRLGERTVASPVASQLARRSLAVADEHADDRVLFVDTVSSLQRYATLDDVRNTHAVSDAYLGVAHD